jgi:AraC-like DNA-binding protein
MKFTPRVLPQLPCSRASLPLGSLASWRAKRVRRYVDENLGKPLDTHTLASIAYVSRSHFCRAFKRTFGFTVHRYVMQRRIERAQHLMLTTSATLSEIAVTCGLSDHSHMSRLFRRIVDASPAEWREHNRQDSAARSHEQRALPA